MRQQKIYKPFLYNAQGLLPQEAWLLLQVYTAKDHQIPLIWRDGHFQEREYRLAGCSQLQFRVFDRKRLRVIVCHYLTHGLRGTYSAA